MTVPAPGRVRRRQGHRGGGDLGLVERGEISGERFGRFGRSSSRLRVRHPRRVESGSREQRLDLPVLQAPVGPVVEHPDEEEPPGGREVRGKRHRFGKAAGDHLGGTSLVGATTGEALQEDDAERPDVGFGPDVMVLELFGRHVRRSAERGPLRGEGRGVREKGDAEVAEARRSRPRRA